eukprot:COSAG06_NODE_3342_length_5481_cov_2.258826_1_plen_267_part_10
MRVWLTYEQYKQRIAAASAAAAPAAGTADGGGGGGGGSGGGVSEQLVFHGCADEAIPGILESGFLKSFWKSAAGDWQRFGPGFYFALQASKSHEYPLGAMSALGAGEHSRTMVLCKVAKGRVYQTRQNMSELSGSAPAGYHSVHGIATADGALNYDELVVFEEEAVLPYALVTYRFLKKEATQQQQQEQQEQEPEPEPEADADAESDADPSPELQPDSSAAANPALASVRALGFPEEAASAALAACGGDVQQAIESLLAAAAAPAAV